MWSWPIGGLATYFGSTKFVRTFFLCTGPGYNSLQLQSSKNQRTNRNLRDFKIDIIFGAKINDRRK